MVKDAFGRPYIPGSSLRGRLRALLEQSSGLAVPSELVYLSRRKGQEVRIHQSDRPDDDIGVLFGRNPGRMERVQGDALETTVATPSRLTVYDAALDAESITQAMRENLDDELTEVKSENAVDRITSQANPRTLERVPAGARFRVRMVMDIFCDDDKPLFARVVEGLRLLEDDALGGGWLPWKRTRAAREHAAGLARPRFLLRRRSGAGTSRGQRSRRGSRLGLRRAGIEAGINDIRLYRPLQTCGSVAAWPFLGRA